MSEFSQATVDLANSTGKLLIVGDFNFWINKNDDNARTFLGHLESANLKQHVHERTHKLGNILDLVISNPSELVVNNLHFDNSVPSDHSAVLFNISVPKPPRPKKDLEYRKYKNMDLEQFRTDTKMKTTSILETGCVTEAVNKYNLVMKELLELHAPLAKKTVTERCHFPWYNEDIRAEKQKRRQLERKWRRSRLTSDFDAYSAQCNLTQKMSDEAKRVYYRDAVSTKDQKELYKAANKLLSRQKVDTLPSHRSAEELANQFADFFEDKIIKIRENLEISRASNSSQADEKQEPPKVTKLLSNFEPASEEEVLKLIRQSASKSCPLDPIPTWLLKECQQELLPVITHIVNLSLSTSIMPSDFKEALINPLIKKALLDSEIFKNYRPVSNLAFLSKIIEKVVAARYLLHIEENKLSEKMQSAYTKFHSTETALVRVQNDLLQAIDKHGAAVLVLLDLSAAFDTIDHKVLLSRLEKDLGITASALAWFASYLEDRHQTVLINGKRSEKRKLKFGVPQGSVLGPLLYVAYTLDIGRIARKHGLQYHLYADDTQLYLAFNPTMPGSLEETLKRIKNCVNEIKSWMASNFLKLNDDKTEIIILSKPANFKNDKLNISILIGDSEVRSSEHVRNLGVIFDRTINLGKHVNNVCKNANYQLRNIGLNRKYLDKNSTKALVHALVTSRLDYCNSLLYKANKCHLQKLQKVQNTAARVITRLRKYDHITEAKIKLHWLPIEQRIQYKILLLTFKAINGHAPAYISELIEIKKPGRYSTRSADGFQMVRGESSTIYGDRAFQKAASDLWNELPLGMRKSFSSCEVENFIQQLKQFKTSLKTLLFRRAYELEENQNQ